ncbi:MAG: ferritin [bacterium]
MLGKKIGDALNEQLNFEFYSAYLYLSMAAYFEAISLNGFAHWMRSQAKEELMHAMKIYYFVGGRAGRIVLRAVDAPPKEWASPLAAFENAYKHEQKVSGRINNIVTLAIKENDHATVAFLQWFVTEQVEEEKTASEVVEKLKLIDDDKGGLFMLDRELAARAPIFNLPIEVAQA